MLGARLDLRGLAAERLAAKGPNTYALDSGRYVAAFRYGVVVFFGMTEEEQLEQVQRLAPCVKDPMAAPEREELEIRADEEAPEGLDADGILVLSSLEVQRLQVVAHVLAKSTVLAHYEERVAGGFSRVESRAEELKKGPSRRRARVFLTEIGEALAIQAQTVGRVEVTEKPEIVWNDSELDRLYELLAIEYEIRDRDAALSRKLRLISDAASTSLELIHTRQNLRVEWYIVILIVVEIVLSVYDLAWH